VRWGEKIAKIKSQNQELIERLNEKEG